MLEVVETVELDAAASDVWAVIGDFGALADWHPAAVTSSTEQRGGETVRVINIPGGGVLVEQLLQQDDENMSQQYSILEGPLPVNNYTSIISVKPQGETCQVRWEGTFEASGADDENAKKVVRGIYTSGLSALQKRFG